MKATVVFFQNDGLFIGQSQAAFLDFLNDLAGSRRMKLSARVATRFPRGASGHAITFAQLHAYSRAQPGRPSLGFVQSWRKPVREPVNSFICKTKTPTPPSVKRTIPSAYGNAISLWKPSIITGTTQLIRHSESHPNRLHQKPLCKIETPKNPHILDTTVNLQMVFPTGGDLAEAIVAEILKAATVANKSVSGNPTRGQEHEANQKIREPSFHGG
jgi:hypothetical protein